MLQAQRWTWLWRFWETFHQEAHVAGEVFESKIDDDGSNCPTIEDIIYEVSKNDRLDYIEDYIIFTLIYFVLVTIKFICKYKEITK